MCVIIFPVTSLAPGCGKNRGDLRAAPLPFFFFCLLFSFLLVLSSSHASRERCNRTGSPSRHLLSFHIFSHFSTLHYDNFMHQQIFHCTAIFTILICKCTYLRNGKTKTIIDKLAFKLAFQATTKIRDKSTYNKSKYSAQTGYYTRCLQKTYLVSGIKCEKERERGLMEIFQIIQYDPGNALKTMCLMSSEFAPVQTMAR